jgi:hypothetical protein
MHTYFTAVLKIRIHKIIYVILLFQYCLFIYNEDGNHKLLMIIMF